MIAIVVIRPDYIAITATNPTPRTIFTIFYVGIFTSIAVTVIIVTTGDQISIAFLGIIKTMLCGLQ